MKKIALLVVAMLFGALVACTDQGPAERAGEEIDEAAESAQRDLEEAGEEIDDAVDDAREEIEDAAN